MLMGRVVGTVVASRKDEKLEGLRFLLVKQIDLDLGESDKIVVAVDSVGAGLGEVVLFASGSSARQTIMTDNRPVDATIMAIVDSFDVKGQSRYNKFEDDSSGNYDPVE
ncbi:MAG: EutN/CcmL family microcompartment protein [Pseudomonadota bacterium]